MRDETSGSGIVIRRGSGLPLYRQLVDQLRYLIAAGRYRPGEYLPTMRELAEELGVNFNTVNRAYQQLQRDGLVRSTPGKGARVLAGEGERPGVERPVSPGEVDEILAAAVERALAGGLSPADLAARLGRLVDEAARRVPPPPRLRVRAGRDWRGRALAARLAAATGIEALAAEDVDDGAARREVVVRPRYGAWRAEEDSDSNAPEVELQVLPGRAAVRALVDLEPGCGLCAVAADEGVAQWLLDAAATFASPAATRWVATADAASATLGDGEWAVYEEGLPGAAALGGAGRAIAVEAIFPPTAFGALEAALERARRAD